MISPVVEQAGCLRSDAPRAGILDLTPAVHPLAQLVDDWSRVVQLVLRRDSGTFFEHNRLLLDSALALFGLGIGVMNCAERRASTMR